MTSVNDACTHAVFDWTHSSNETRPSAKNPELIDQPSDASNWLKRISVVNQKHIKMVPG